MRCCNVDLYRLLELLYVGMVCLDLYRLTVLQCGFISFSLFCSCSCVLFQSFLSSSLLFSSSLVRCSIDRRAERSAAERREKQENRQADRQMKRGKGRQERSIDRSIKNNTREREREHTPTSQSKLTHYYHRYYYTLLYIYTTNY